MKINIDINMKKNFQFNRFGQINTLEKYLIY